MSSTDSSDSGERRPAPPSEPHQVAHATVERDDEDALDLADLDRLGVDGVVAQLHNDPLPGDPVPPARVRRGRSTFLSIIISVIGLYMLVEVFPDFRYWLSSRTPDDLGDAADLAKNGKLPDGLHNRYATLRGTPDVRNAIRMEMKDQYVGYLRITEAGGGLFAAVPRAKDERMRDTFEGSFTGRLRRLRNDPAFDWLAEYVANHPITRTIDATPAALWAAVGETAGAMTLATAEGDVALENGDRLSIVVQSPDARVQIGTHSVRKVEDAEARVAALGHPYARLAGPSESLFHSFVVRVPPSERAAALATLQSGLDDPSEGTDPKRGAAVLPGMSTLSVKPDEIALSGDQLLVPATLAGTPIYDVEDGELVAREPVDGRIRVPQAWVQSVRLDRLIALDPEGYVLVVGDDPSKQWMMGLVWLVIATIVGLNAASLAMRWRRHSADAL